MEAIMQVDAEPVEEFVEVSGEIEVLETRENMEEPEKTVDPAEEHPEDEKDKVEFKISDLK